MGCQELKGRQEEEDKVKATNLGWGSEMLKKERLTLIVPENSLGS